MMTAAATERRFTDEVLDEIVDMRDNRGMSFGAIGAEYGIAPVRARYLYTRRSATRHKKKAKALAAAPRQAVPTPAKGHRAAHTRCSLLGVRGYDPNGFLDFCRETLDAPTDAALARMLGMTSPHLSKFRSRIMPVSASFLIRFHEESGVPFATIREQLGIGQEVRL